MDNHIIERIKMCVSKNSFTLFLCNHIFGEYKNTCIVTNSFAPYTMSTFYISNGPLLYDVWGIHQPRDDLLLCIGKRGQTL